MNQMRQVDNRRRLMLAAHFLLWVWPAVCVVHALVSTVSYVLTGEAWNPMLLDAGRIIAAYVLGAICVIIDQRPGGPGHK